MRAQIQNIRFFASIDSRGSVQGVGESAILSHFGLVPFAMYASRQDIRPRFIARHTPGTSVAHVFQLPSLKLSFSILRAQP